MVEVCCAPVVVCGGVGVALRVRADGGGSGKVMQQPRLVRPTGPHDPLERPRRVPRHLCLGIPVTRPRHERSNSRHKPDEVRKRALEARQHRLVRPDVWRRVRRVVRVGVLRRRGGGGGEEVRRGGGEVCVVGAFEGVEAAGGEGFFAEGPAGQVGCAEGFEEVWCGV